MLFRSTSGLFLSPGSAIDASSQFGVNGIVAIETPDLQSGEGLVELDSEPLDPDRTIASACAATTRSGSFTNVGHNGLPADFTTNQLEFGGLVRPRAIGTHGREATAQALDLSAETRDGIAEARDWRRDRQGRPVLDASATVVAIADNTGCAAYPSADSDSSTSRR